MNELFQQVLGLRVMRFRVEQLHTSPNKPTAVFVCVVLFNWLIVRLFYHHLCLGLGGAVQVVFILASSPWTWSDT